MWVLCKVCLGESKGNDSGKQHGEANDPSPDKIYTQEHVFDEIYFFHSKYLDKTVGVLAASSWTLCRVSAEVAAIRERHVYL
jgi:hypothetical protein